jgi:hypothetical protein
MMSNGSFCCAIGLCCDAASAQRRAALISELSHGLAEKRVGLADDVAETRTLEHIAEWLIENVDMLPKGSVDLSKVLDAMKAKG